MPVPPRLPDFDPFAVLGVTPDDPPDAIKAAWRQRVKEHHPDTSGGTDERIKRINVAYEWLRDPTLRLTLLAARSGGISLGARPGWGPPPAWEQPSAWGPPPPAWPDDIDPAAPDDAVAAPDGGPYEGPRSARVTALVDRIAAARMADLLDLVHSWRPELAWAVALARGVESSGRRAGAAAAVWEVRTAVRDRIAVLLQDPVARQTYDDELVGQVVSDRLADLVRGIVLLDLLARDARARVEEEWIAVMGFDAGGPGDELLLDGEVGPIAVAHGRWARVPDGLRWVLIAVAAAAWAVAMVMVLPSREALAMIVLGFAAVLVLARARGRPAA